MNNADLGNGRTLSVSDHAMHPWHGAKKEAVLEHFLRSQISDMSEQEIQTNVEVTHFPKIQSSFELFLYSI